MCLASGWRLSQICALIVPVLAVGVQALDNATAPSSVDVLQYSSDAESGWQVTPKGTELRILCVGDSITTGFLSDQDGGDGDGYRGQLEEDLHKNKVVFAGTDKDGKMKNGYFSAWRGQTIQYIADHVGPGLEQRPNLILVHAGTNDMNPNPNISLQGTDAQGAADRLGALIDQIVEKCPDATVLVAIIINTCVPEQEENTRKYQALIPGVVQRRADDGHHVLAVNFTTFSTDLLRDCIHPTNDGYKIFGNYWYDFVTQVPMDWIKAPVGKDPKHSGSARGSGSHPTWMLMAWVVVVSSLVGFHAQTGTYL